MVGQGRKGIFHGHMDSQGCVVGSFHMASVILYKDSQSVLLKGRFQKIKAREFND